MSFSNRDSLWANSACVVTVSPDDPILDKYKATHGQLAGLEFQRDMERRAWDMGGGNLTVPVQRLTDFVTGRESTTVPASSYRLGVKSARCDEIYPKPLTNALINAITEHFEKQMPGFLTDEGEFFAHNCVYIYVLPLSSNTFHVSSQSLNSWSRDTDIVST